MNLVINGNTVQLSSDMKTIADVTTHFFPDNQVFIVEHNGEILEKDVHPNRVVTDGDKIELVQFVGGG